jgi:hypothetical protein
MPDKKLTDSGEESAYCADTKTARQKIITKRSTNFNNLRH